MPPADQERATYLDTVAVAVGTPNENEDGQVSPPSPAGQTPAGKGATGSGNPAGVSTAQANQPGATAAQANPDWDKKIVKTANLQLEVKNYRSFYDQLHQAVRQSGGYIAQEEQSQSSYKIENTVSIKVPVARFDEFLSQLASDSDRLVEKKFNAEDVTLDIVDTKSRLETKREVRERYPELLREARNMNDILKVQHEISDIQEEMEGAAGRIG